MNSMQIATPLSNFLCNEFRIQPESLVFIRHSIGKIEQLKRYGGDVRDYTLIQPENTRYDFLKYVQSQPVVVAAIIDDRVNEIYELSGQFESGMIRSLVNSGHRQMDVDNNAADRIGKKFSAITLKSEAIEKPVKGWENRARTTVQYFGDRFFDEIMIEMPLNNAPRIEIIEKEYENNVAIEYAKIIAGTSDFKSAAVGTLHPISHIGQAKFYLRDARVAALALVRSKWLCEACGSIAPFNRKSDNQPYLEVHHKIRLADRGPDTLENVLALCPNCHRKAHYG